MSAMSRHVILVIVVVVVAVVVVVVVVMSACKIQILANYMYRRH